MNRPLLLVTGSLGLFLLFLSDAIARPVTNADLEGRKICWQDSDETETYFPGGKFVNSRYGEGTWKQTAKGFETRIAEHTYHGNFQVQQDGTMTYSGSWIGLPKTYETATYCE
jgi:hypothetical protein